MKREPEVFLGLGSNMGRRLVHLRKAHERIRTLPGTSVLSFSSVYESAPVGYRRQPDFLNMVLQIATDLFPAEFLEKLQLIEKELGRVKNFRWGPRVIDIDILYWGKKVLESDSLRIPHPEAQKRKFVLVPLHEIVPEFAAPPSNDTISKLVEQLSDENGIKMYMSREQFADM